MIILEGGGNNGRNLYKSLFLAFGYVICICGRLDPGYKESYCESRQSLYLHLHALIPR
jgi:hypothetical protein